MAQIGDDALDQLALLDGEIHRAAMHLIAFKIGSGRIVAKTLLSQLIVLAIHGRPTIAVKPCASSSPSDVPRAIRWIKELSRMLRHDPTGAYSGPDAAARGDAAAR